MKKKIRSRVYIWSYWYKKFFKKYNNRCNINQYSGYEIIRIIKEIYIIFINNAKKVLDDNMGGSSSIKNKFDFC